VKPAHLRRDEPAAPAHRLTRAGETSSKGSHFRRGTAVAASRRVGLTLADQGFSSISNFVVGVAVARSAGAAGLGGFSFAYAGWLVLAALHRSLITDPMAIDGDLRTSTTAHGIKRGFAAEVLLGAVGTFYFGVIGTVLMLVHARTFGFSMLVLAPWLPVLLVQDYWRWVGFMSRRPGCALLNDAVFNSFQAAGFAAVFFFHSHSEAALIGSWGLGAAAGAVFGLGQYRVAPAFRGGWSLLRSRWRMSKWIAGSSVTSWGATQVYVFIAASVLGPAGLGGLRAAQALVSGPSGVLIMAGGSIGLPEATKAYAEKGWRGLVRVARLVTMFGCLSFVAGAVIVVLWGRTLLSHIYGPQFAHLELTAVLFGVAYIFVGLFLGPILVLKATRQTRWLMSVQSLCVAVYIVGLVGFSLAFGVPGVALAAVVAYPVTAVAYRWCQHRVRRSFGSAGVAKEAHPVADHKAMALVSAS
jgi:O-antigen/teichoic acid export membrane protein